MSLGLVFWILMLLWLVFGLATNRGMIAATYTFWGNTFLLFLLFLLLGWRAFGPPIAG